MRIHIIPEHKQTLSNISVMQPAILRLIAENAAEEAQINQEYIRLKNAGAKVSWYGKEAYGGSDHMALGLEVELA